MDNSALSLLSESDKATLRASLCYFELDLIQNGLGKDDHGKKLVEMYLASIKSLRKRLIADQQAITNASV